MTPGHDEQIAVSARLIALQAENDALRARLAEVTASEARFKDAVELSTMALCHHDLDLRYTWIFHPHMGFHANDVLGKSDWDILEPELADRMGAIKRQVLATGIGVRVDIPTRLDDPDAEVFDLTVEPLRDGTGAITGLSCAGINITGQKRVEQALRGSEQLLKDVQNVANLGHYVYDFQSDRWESSEVLDRIFGIPADYPRDAAHWLKLIAPDMQDEMARYLADIRASGTQFDHEYAITRQNDGERRWVSGLGVIRRDDQGLPLRMIGTIHDLTDRKEAENRISRLSRLYKTQSIVDQAIARIPGHDELFALACRCAVDYGGMIMAFVCRHDDQSELFYPVARHGDQLDYPDRIHLTSRVDEPEGRGPIATVFRTSRSVFVNSFTQNEMTQPWRKESAGRGWLSTAALPILRDGKPYAVISVYNAKQGGFDDEVVTELERLAQSISFAVDNHDREARRKRAEDDLRLAALVYNESSEAMVVTEPDGTIIGTNQAFTRLTGYCEAEVLGQSTRLLKSGTHDTDFYRSIWRQLNTTGQWQGEIYSRRKNGEIFPEWLTINTVFNQDGTAARRVALFSDITEQKKSQETIWRQANFDALTGLPNRHMFLNRLEQEIKKANRTGQVLALMFIDLDRFKEVNDTLGHERGDQLLQEVAGRLQSCVRETDGIGRLGGDEFTVILNTPGDIASVNRVAGDVLQKLSAPYQLGDDRAYVSASIGITLYPADAQEINGLLKNADQAMYQSKHQGRNRFQYFEAAMQVAALSRAQLANDLRSALAGGQFQVLYQPIKNLRTGEITKAEALLRWHHPELGLISPAHFIPIAEETGLIVDIGRWVFHEAANQAAKWRSHDGTAIQISVNKSPVQFRERLLKKHEWRDYLIGLGLKGDSIVVEITESMLLDASDIINEKLLDFRDAGIQVALDDFGTGYSSLSYLKKFDIDYLKIDQSFVGGLAPNSSDAVLCEAIIVMAHKLGMKVIAEGIETEIQRDILIEADCDYAQGYLFSKPITAKDFEAFFPPVR